MPLPKKSESTPISSTSSSIPSISITSTDNVIYEEEIDDIPVKSGAPTVVSRIVKSSSFRSSSTTTTTTTTTKPSSSSSSHNANTSQLLWVDKYKPQKLDDIVGAGESARKILDWLKKWPEVHLKKTLKVYYLLLIFLFKLYC